MTREIPLSKGLVALVDAADFDWLSQWKWMASGGGYAVRSQRGDGRNFSVTMHREILGVQPGQMVDHINRNRVDNRRANLRLADYTQNLINREFANRTGYRGVRADSKSCFVARIKPAGEKQKTLGYFKTAEEAARAYDAAALLLHGDFAQLNFLDPPLGARPASGFSDRSGPDGNGSAPTREAGHGAGEVGPEEARRLAD